MPMYFPDLKSVKQLTEKMARHEGKKKYQGIIPQNEEDLLEARKQLAEYMRLIWKDEVFALEIELAVDKNNYHERLGDHIRKKFGF